MITLLVNLPGQFSHGLRLNGQAQRRDTVNPLQIGSRGFGVLANPMVDFGGGFNRSHWHDVGQGRLLMATKIQRGRD